MCESITIVVYILLLGKHAEKESRTGKICFLIFIHYNQEQ